MIPKELADLTELGLVPVAGGRSPAYTATKSRLIDARAIAALARAAQSVPGGTVRINLHPGPEAAVHDMVIAQRAGGPPHVHKHLEREETYHLIAGRMRLRFFDDAGRPVEECRVGGPGSGLPLIVRVPKGVWHATEPEPEGAVFHESRPGPFDPADTLIFSETRVCSPPPRGGEHPSRGPSAAGRFPPPPTGEGESSGEGGLE